MVIKGKGLILMGWLAFFLLLVFTYSCKEKNGIQEEYRQIAEATSKLSNGVFYIIDTDSSQVLWEVQNSTGQVLSGKITPEKGSLILEKERLVGGFIASSFKNIFILKNEMKLNPTKEKKKLLDSLPKLRSEKAKILRIDIEQSGRQIMNSGFREGINPGIDTSVTHILQVSVLFGDSIKNISLPATLIKKPNRITLNAKSSISYSEFGIQTGRYGSESSRAWNSWIPLKFHLVFKPYAHIAE